eukprot:scaffold64985_cov17-Tisochrysis_lutea.AAC.2
MGRGHQPTWNSSSLSFASGNFTPRALASAALSAKKPSGSDGSAGLLVLGATGVAAGLLEGALAATACFCKHGEIVDTNVCNGVCATMAPARFLPQDFAAACFCKRGKIIGIGEVRV